jgi:hypothetical protein
MSQADDTMPAEEKFESNALSNVAAAALDSLVEIDAASAADCASCSASCAARTAM